jgi:hypothetical protein
VEQPALDELLDDERVARRSRAPLLGLHDVRAADLLADLSFGLLAERLVTRFHRRCLRRVDDLEAENRPGLQVTDLVEGRHGAGGALPHPLEPLPEVDLA